MKYKKQLSHSAQEGHRQQTIASQQTMKAIGVATAAIGVIFFAIYIVAWIALVVEHGADAVRIGFTIWPGNAVGFAVLALGIVFGISGWTLLGDDRRHR